VDLTLTLGAQLVVTLRNTNSHRMSQNKQQKIKWPYNQRSRQPHKSWTIPTVNLGEKTRSYHPVDSNFVIKGISTRDVSYKYFKSLNRTKK
jgi:hypothetical protein